MAEQIHEYFEAYPEDMLADGGFAAHKDIEAVQQRGCTVYAPVPQPKDPEQDRYAPHPGDSAAIRDWRARMATAEAKAIYKARAATAECVNAQARNRGLVRLLVRGLWKVKAIALWFALAHNVACGVRLCAAAGLPGVKERKTEAAASQKRRGGGATEPRKARGHLGSRFEQRSAVWPSQSSRWPPEPLPAIHSHPLTY